jgi:hypothetical protein
MITHHGVQQVLTNYVAATDFPHQYKTGKLTESQLQEFDKFFTRMTDILGKNIYYVGCEDKQHTFTDELGWRQYMQFIKTK